MSTVSDLAKDEADKTEQEQLAEEEEAAVGELEGEPEPEPETPPQPEPAAMTEQQADRLFKRLETAAQRYLKTAMPLTEELGMPVQACPLCTFPGLAIPRQAHEVTSDVEAAVLAMIGKGVEPSYKSSQAYARCEVCDGWGDVLTGAQKDISRTAMCMACGGKGYINSPTPITPPAPPLAVTYPGSAVTFTPLPAGTNDAWGRPAGHPHWGVDPAMVGSPNDTQFG